MINLRHLLLIGFALAVSIAPFAWAMWGTDGENHGTQTTATSSLQIGAPGTANSAIGLNTINIGGPNIVTSNGIQYICYFDTASPPNVKIKTRNIASGTITSYNPTGLPANPDNDVHRVCAIGVDNNGIIHISYGLFFQNGLNIYHSTSALNPSAFTPSTTPGGGAGVEFDAIYPFIVPNPRNGELYLIWEDQVGGSITNAGEYFYHWNTSTTRWEAAAGTGTGGIVYNGSANNPTTGLYLNGIPKWDSNGVLWINWEEWQGVNNGAANQYLIGWNGSSFIRPDGTAQSIPVLQSNEASSVTIPAATKLVTQNDFAIGPSNIFYIAYAHNDGGGIQQIWVAENSGGSFTEHQLTKNTATPPAICSPACGEPQVVAVADSAGNAYVMYPDAYTLPRSIGYIVNKSPDNFAHWWKFGLLNRYLPNFVLNADPIRRYQNIISYLVMDEDEPQYGFNYPFNNAGQMQVIDWVLPSNSNSTLIPCDQGPSTSLPLGGLGSDLTTAGFTHCVLNADWTTTTTDGNGINWSNPNTWLDSCGATMPFRFYLRWGSGFNMNGDAITPQPACGRAQITTDGGVQVLHLQFNPSDFNANSTPYATYVLQLSYPACGNNCTANGPWLPITMFVEYTYRLGAGLTQNGSHAMINSIEEAIPDNTPSPGQPNGWIDQPMLESLTTDSALPYAYTTMIDDYFNSGGSKNGYGWGWEPDLGNYHTLGWLKTSDGTTTFSACFYLDGVGFHPLPGGFYSNPVNCYTIQPISFVADNKNVQHYQRVFHSIGNFDRDAGGVNNTIDLYIKKLRIFSCATYKTTMCNSTIVTHNF